MDQHIKKTIRSILEHKNYKEPFLAFAPSIGISDIEFITKFIKRWKGDFLLLQ